MATYVPIVRQAYDYSCGAAALASCLYYCGVWNGREPELYSRRGTDCDGTSRQAIMQVAGEYGRRPNDILLMDPSVAGRYALMSRLDFEARWPNWSDDGEVKEYHTAILLKGRRAMDLSQPYYITL